MPVADTQQKLTNVPSPRELKLCKLFHRNPQNKTDDSPNRIRTHDLSYRFNDQKQWENGRTTEGGF